jgi:hypothetical protein
LYQAKGEHDRALLLYGEALGMFVKVLAAGHLWRGKCPEGPSPVPTYGAGAL